jgi:hypothetical protein
VRITDDPAFASAQGDIDHSALPGHPHRKRPDRIDGFLGMETDTAFSRAPGIVMQHPETAKYLDLPVIHPDWNAELVLPQGYAEKIPGCLIQVQHFGGVIELLLGYLEWVVGFFFHVSRNTSRSRVGPYL